MMGESASVSAQPLMVAAMAARRRALLIEAVCAGCTAERSGGRARLARFSPLRAGELARIAGQPPANGQSQSRVDFACSRQSNLRG